MGAGQAELVALGGGYQDHNYLPTIGKGFVISHLMHFGWNISLKQCSYLSIFTFGSPESSFLWLPNVLRKQKCKQNISREQMLSCTHDEWAITFVFLHPSQMNQGRTNFKPLTERVGYWQTQAYKPNCKGCPGLPGDFWNCDICIKDSVCAKHFCIPYDSLLILNFAFGTYLFEHTKHSTVLSLATHKNFPFFFFFELILDNIIGYFSSET